jgi:Zn-dependent protease with chaperone function
LSVIGHECGHIHNNHVVYLTALHYLTNVAGLFVRNLSLPALLALRAWSRRAEITCDRAGALCAGNLDPSLKALTKLALGSQKLYDQLNIEAFLEQHDEAQQSIGRFGEVFATHPWLPKRVLALRAFAESELFRRHCGLGNDGVSMRDVDERVHGLIKVLG